MFKHAETKESQTGVVTVTDHTSEAVSDMLEYMYSGQLKNLDKMAEELFQLADKYNISNLKKICEEILIKKLSLDNACRLLMLADLHSANDLKKACIKFIFENRKTLLQTEEWNALKSLFVFEEWINCL